MRYSFILFLLLIVPVSLATAASDGMALYAQYCASCHDTGAGRAPSRDELAQLSKADILRALEGGTMRPQGIRRTSEERAALADFLSSDNPGPNRRPNDRRPLAPKNTCPFSRPPVDLSDPHWSAWGGSLTNERSASAQAAGLTATEVPKLRLKWAFGFPGAASAAVQPTIVGRWVFVGSSSGRIYALDLREGCVYWTFDAAQEVRTAITIAPIPRAEAGGAHYAAYFSDRSATVYSLNPITGELRWKRHVGSPTAGGTGSPAVYEGRIYVPLTAGGEAAGSEASHGAVAALDADTGAPLWESSTLQSLPHGGGTQDQATRQDPNGVSAWSAPTVDVRTNRLYIGTGDAHTDPAGPTSDSILAYDLRTGAIVWVHQATSEDAYTEGCDHPPLKGCPAENGPDFDFGEPPALVTLDNGRRLLVAGQKSGLVYGLDPDDKGREIWRTRVATGGVLGGVNWGLATDRHNAYVAVGDHLDIVNRDAINPDAGGLVALRLSDGQLLWRTKAPSGCPEHEGTNQRLHSMASNLAPPGFGCSTAQSAPVTLIPGVVFSGSLDGHLRAYATDTGRILWDFDTAREFLTVNFVEAHGGSIDVGGAAVVDGIVLTTSGYAQWEGMHGNVLLAFSAEDEH